MLTNELFDIPRRREVTGINIVPILDMLTTIIFFLLLSTSFLQYNKLTVPPSRTSVITSPEAPPPLQARMLVAKVSPGEYKLVLHWAGAKPGVLSAVFAAKADSPELNDNLAKKAQEFVAQYKSQFKDERTLQLGLGAKVPMSKLILLMDSVREVLPDIVLISAADAQVEAEKFDGVQP
jgi:hypothetical protein